MTLYELCHELIYDAVTVYFSAVKLKNARSIMKTSGTGRSRPSFGGSVILFSAKAEIKALDEPFLCQG